MQGLGEALATTLIMFFVGGALLGALVFGIGQCVYRHVDVDVEYLK